MDTAPSTDGLRIREAARAVVLSDDTHVLLVRFEFPTATVWAPPGGGLEPGETHVEALARELAEEAGLHDVTIGPHVWNRLHVIPFEDGSWDGQRERFHLVRVHERIEPAPTMSWEELRAERVHDVRWVPISDLGLLPRPDDTRPVFLRPDGFAEHVQRLLDDGPPDPPIDVPV